MLFIILHFKTVTFCLFLDAVDHIVIGTVIQEVKTSNIAREVLIACHLLFNNSLPPENIRVLFHLTISINCPGDRCGKVRKSSIRGYSFDVLNRVLLNFSVMKNKLIRNSRDS